MISAQPYAGKRRKKPVKIHEIAAASRTLVIPTMAQVTDAWDSGLDTEKIAVRFGVPEAIIYNMLNRDDTEEAHKARRDEAMRTRERRVAA